MRRLLVYILLLVPAVAVGQGVLEGVVRDAAQGGVLEYVNVGIEGRGGGTVTDARGRYRLEVATGDSVTVVYSFVGYEPVRRRVGLRGGRVLKLNVGLRPKSKELTEVEVTGEQTREGAFSQIEVDRLEAAVGPTGGVEGVLKLLPDVQSSNELSSQYSVRGGSFDENLVYIDGVEVFRPMLIRSGQQEGMSIVNSDLVSRILFSPGGFDATYGDKLSSVLDISYEGECDSLSGRVGVSLLGGSATLRGGGGGGWRYGVSVRSQSNAYVLGSLDTKGRYTTRYADLQGWVRRRVGERLDLGVLGVVTRNVYGLVPESQTTTFGGFFLPLVLRVYFDGQEEDRYHTALGAFSARWRPNDDWYVRGGLSVQHINEGERYDVQSQYFLYEVASGETAGDTSMFDRGVGTFLEHARNRLTTDIASAEVRASRYARLGNWGMGLRLQLERVSDHLREWRWVDSAGFALPSAVLPMGDSGNVAVAPVLQGFARSDQDVRTWRLSGFVQREVGFATRRGSDVKVVVGARGQLYRFSEGEGARFVFSPRASVGYKPQLRHDVLFRLAAGVYQQPPFYREYRRPDGGLVGDLPAQKSYQVMGTMDWRFSLWRKPFTFTADLYYKYITDLVPYEVDNLRLRYMPDERARGYAAGLSLRLNGVLVEGLESWASLSVMRTQEDIEGDGLGWLARPTDQRVSFKLFLQDNVPDMPWWRMSLNMVFATGMPVTIPMMARSEEAYRLPSYYRVDWGNTIRLSQFERLKRKKVFRVVDDIQVGIEVFNLFNFRNVVSYLWVSDYESRYYPVPNYLTARQLNVKLTVLF